MHSAFNLLSFPNSMFTPLLLFFYFFLKGYVLSGEVALKNNHYYYIIIIITLCINKPVLYFSKSNSFNAFNSIK